jgi:hypothetical protein
MVIVILFCIAALCFALAAAGVASRINLVASGLMFMALAFALNAGLLV